MEAAVPRVQPRECPSGRRVARGAGLAAPCGDRGRGGDAVVRTGVLRQDSRRERVLPIKRGPSRPAPGAGPTTEGPRQPLWGRPRPAGRGPCALWGTAQGIAAPSLANTAASLLPVRPQAPPVSASPPLSTRPPLSTPASSQHCLAPSVGASGSVRLGSQWPTQQDRGPGLRPQGSRSEAGRPGLWGCRCHSQR